MRLLVVGIGSLIVFGWVFAWSLCRSAADGDAAIRTAEEMEPIEGVFVPPVRR